MKQFNLSGKSIGSPITVKNQAGYYVQLRTALTGLFYVLSLSTGLLGATINVPADFTSIQAAANSAAANDVIIVADGTYNETLDFSSVASGITIKAANQGGAIINSSGIVITITSRTTPITIEGFVLRTSLNSSAMSVIRTIDVSGLVTIANNRFDRGGPQFFTEGIRSSGSADMNLSILNNTFVNFDDDELITLIINGSSNIVIDGNTDEVGIEDDAIEIEYGAGNDTHFMRITNNTFDNFTSSGDGIDIDFGAGFTPQNIEHYTLIQGNTIANPNGAGMRLDIEGVGGVANYKIDNNTINGASTNVTNWGILITEQVGSTNFSTNFQITNNTISNTRRNSIEIIPAQNNGTRSNHRFTISDNNIDRPNSDNVESVTFGVTVEEAGILVQGIDNRPDVNVFLEIFNNTFTNISAITDCIIIDEPPASPQGAGDFQYSLFSNTCSNGNTPVISPDATVNVDPIPFTQIPTTLGGFIWDDANLNGIQDPGERGIAGVQVNLNSNNNLSGSTFTNNNGEYFFSGLSQSLYLLTVVLPNDFQNRSPQNLGNGINDSDYNPASGQVSVTVFAGDADKLDIDAGLSMAPLINCLPGFIDDGFGNCIDIDECATGNPCGPNQICTNTNGGFVCDCASGYIDDGFGNCIDIDECAASNPCDPNATCTNLPGSFQCD
ncbi:MAG: SdrD B-like domain-containing protein, partial [Bacteroidota bacterium]